MKKKKNFKPKINNKFDYNKLLQAKYLILASVLISFFYFAWYAYTTQINNQNEADLPLILAPKQVKFKPLDPGGLIVPNKDKHIYDHVLGKTTIKPIKTYKENEKPIDRADIPTIIKKQIKNSRNK